MVLGGGVMLVERWFFEKGTKNEFAGWLEGPNNYLHSNLIR